MAPYTLPEASGGDSLRQLGKGSQAARGPALPHTSTAAGPSSPLTPSSPQGPLRGRSLGNRASRPEPRDQPRASCSFCRPEQHPLHFWGTVWPFRPTPWAGGGRWEAGQMRGGRGVAKAGKSEDGVL